jgi:hypothetical protein
VAVFFVLYLANAWAPETSPDGSGYHLGFIARYLRAHAFERVTTNWYAALGEGIEMIYAPAFAIGRHSAAALVHFSFLIALALAMAAYGQRIGKPWAGAAAAVLVFVSPVVGIDGTSAYIDVGAATAAFAAFYFLELWDADRNPRLLIPAGLLAGYACAAKYTAFVMVIYAVVFVAWRARKAMLALAVAGCAAIMIAPWMVRDWVWFSNPIAPVGNALFRNPYFYVYAEQDWAAWLRHYDLQSPWQLPLEVTVRGVQTNGMLGPVFLLIPLALFALRDQAGRRLLVAGCVLLTTYPANIGTRFLIPCLPFFALALTSVLGERPVLLTALLVAHAVSSWPDVARKYSPHAWTLERVPIRAALRLESTEAFLRRVDPEYGVARMIEERVPPGEAVLSMNGAADSYTTREVRVAFQAASNSAIADTVNMGWHLDAQPLRAQGLRFAAVAARRIRVVQTAQADIPELWNVHELRFYRGGVEVARRPEWRLRAWPNSWDVQFAFDNSPVTRWRSWEVASPGMYLDVDFGRDENVDEIRMETSPEYSRAHFEAEVFRNGAWQRLPSEPEELTLHPPRPMRRLAIREMKARGVNYLLIRPSDLGAEDFHHDPEGWGLEVVAEGYGATLYHAF